MSEIHYLISDASKKVDVEAHVLRYWEEELELPIPRNDMGHRYYTDLHIRLFRQIKDLKDKGYQLKAIKSVLPKLMGADDNADEPELTEEDLSQMAQAALDEDMPLSETALTHVEEESSMISEDKMEQFQQIMNRIIGQAIQQNTEMLSQEVSDMVSDKVVKELDYLLRVKDEKEDDRFKKLDETIRAYQKGQKSRAEVAATKVPFFQSKKKKRFGRNGKKL